MLEVTTNFHHGKPGIEIRIASQSGNESHSWVRISSGFNKLVGDLKEKTLILGDDDVGSARTGRLVAQETRIVKHSQTEADKAAAKAKAKPTSSPISSPSPTSIPIQERNCTDIEPNGRRLGYRRAANNDAYASVRVALHVSRHGERRLHHRGPRRFPVQGMCTCPLRIARPSLLRTLLSPKCPARFLANDNTSSCNLFNGANPADNTFDICPQQEAFEIVDVLATRVALGRFYFVLCFMKGTQLQSIDFRGLLRVELRNNVLRWRSPLQHIHVKEARTSRSCSHLMISPRSPFLCHIG